MNQQLPPRQALGSRYEIRGQLIGQGATGAVWQAWDNQTDQAVAAKLLWPHYATDHKVLAHFIAEKGILTALNHPGIVRVRDLVFENDQLAIITDLMHGANLAAWLKQQGTLPAIYAVPIAVAILDALDYAHGQGVVHCDVKPANILLAEAGSFTPELVRLADFG
ncbi:MAG: serine/threonine protein kinase, partial [Micrococcales bacterium]|nr:serine/threonine protein kinase [Micrococcales bacterium]